MIGTAPRRPFAVSMLYLADRLEVPEAYARLELDARRTGRSVREVSEATVASTARHHDHRSSDG